MKIHIDFDFWRWLAKLAMSKMVKRGKIPTGIPFHRDPDNICEFYAPGKRFATIPSTNNCQSDGHYLCKECIHLIKEV
jgi:hypothetical protein